MGGCVLMAVVVVGLGCVKVWLSLTMTDPSSRRARDSQPHRATATPSHSTSRSNQNQKAAAARLRCGAIVWRAHCTIPVQLPSFAASGGCRPPSPLALSQVSHALGVALLAVADRHSDPSVSVGPAERSPFLSLAQQ